MGWPNQNASKIGTQLGITCQAITLVQLEVQLHLPFELCARNVCRVSSYTYIKFHVNQTAGFRDIKRDVYIRAHVQLHLQVGKTSDLVT